jgi:hypothetical protein
LHQVVLIAFLMQTTERMVDVPPGCLLPRLKIGGYKMSDVFLLSSQYLWGYWLTGSLQKGAELCVASRAKLYVARQRLKRQGFESGFVKV